MQSLRALRAVLAVAVFLVPSWVSADLMIYGKIYAEIASESAGDGASEVDRTTVDDGQNLGRIGLRFRQDLGEGFTAFGKYEFQAGAPGASGLSDRDAYVGIRGDFGSLAMGRFNSAYKTTGGLEFDAFAYTGLEARGQGGMSSTAFGTEGFVSHAVEYRTPLWTWGETQRFEAVMHYVAGEADTFTSPTEEPRKDSAFAGLEYGYGQFDFLIGGARDEATGSTNVKAGIRLRTEDVTYLVQQESVEIGGYDPGGSGTFALGAVQYRRGNTMYVAQVADYRSDRPGADASYFGVGLRYYLARNIWLTAGYRGTESDIGGLKGDALALGLRFDF